MGLRLHKLKIKAFRSFREEQEITFPEHGLVLIQGKNLDTQGSSGAGKSNLLHAMAYVCGYSPYPATALQSWLTNTKMQVSAEFEGPSGVITLVKGDKPSLTVGDDRQLTAAKSIQERWERETGLPPDLLEALCYRRQRQPGLFLSLTDERKKDFLSQLLDLEELEKIAEEARRRGSDSLMSANVQRSFLAANQADLKEIDLSAVHIPDATAEKQTIADMQVRLDEKRAELKAQEDLIAEEKAMVEEWRRLIREDAAKDLAELREKHQAQVKAFQDELALLKPPDTSTLQQAFRDAQARLKEAVEHLHRMVGDITAVRAQWARTTKAVDGLVTTHKGNCPTCERPWDQSEAHLAHLLAEQDSLRVEVERKMNFQSEAAPVILALEEAAQAAQGAFLRAQEEAKLAERTKAASLSRKESDLLQIYNDKQRWWNDRVGSCYGIQEDKYQYCHQEAKRLHPEVQEMDRTIRACQDIVNKIERDRAAVRGMITEKLRRAEQLKARVLEIETKITDLEAQGHAEQDFSQAVGREGFLSAIFDEVLEEISAEANDLLRSLPNVATTTIQLRSEAETKSGTVKRRITPVVTKNGIEIPLEAGLSGGQLTSVELAVDLAVRNVISRRTGRTPGWLVLDECFEGHDTVVKEACLEILRRAAQDSLILVVDHSSEIKELFDKTIQVESSHDVSLIRSA